MKISRKKRQIKKNWSIFKSRIFWLVLLTLFFLGGITYLLIFSSFFQIKDIQVSGNEKISRQEIQQLIWPKTETGFLRFSSKSIFLAKTLGWQSLIAKKFPLIESLKIKKVFPQTISIEIVERKAIGLWCWENNCFFVDKKGVIFEPGQRPQKLVITSKQPRGAIALGENIVEEKTIGQILLIQKTMKENSKIEVLEFTFFETEKRLNAKTAENWEVYFDLNGNIDWQLVRLELTLEKDLPREKRLNLEYVDLRFSKVYYK